MHRPLPKAFLLLGWRGLSELHQPRFTLSRAALMFRNRQNRAQKSHGGHVLLASSYARLSMRLLMVTWWLLCLQTSPPQSRQKEPEAESHRLRSLCLFIRRQKCPQGVLPTSHWPALGRTAMSSCGGGEALEGFALQSLHQRKVREKRESAGRSRPSALVRASHRGSRCGHPLFPRTLGPTQMQATTPSAPMPACSCCFRLAPLAVRTYVITHNPAERPLPP